ncbi:MAG: hypothetical protein ACXWLH_01050 [Candidatus Saccharimonadales bacterium]
MKHFGSIFLNLLLIALGGLAVWLSVFNLSVSKYFVAIILLGSLLITLGLTSLNKKKSSSAQNTLINGSKVLISVSLLVLLGFLAFIMLAFNSAQH